MKKQGCIIVPYRDRAEHLSAFLQHYKDILPIYIIEQETGKPFNRAKLLNIGFLEFGHKYDYAIYHDVDMLCTHDAAYHVYPEYPLHMATACSQFGYNLPYNEYFGGVTSISTKDMVAVNGFSNNFWSYGGEDDFMYRRCIGKLGQINRVPHYRYECFDHKREIGGKHYQDNLKILKEPDDPTDGLSSCLYEVISCNENHIICSI